MKEKIIKEDLEILDECPKYEPLSLLDKFFSEPEDTMEYNVAWQRKWLETFDGYAEKYADAVKYLYKASEEERFGYDQTAYPIIFLARHSIELQLKSLIRILSPQEDVITHDLDKLWKLFDSSYCSNGKNDESYQAAAKVICELNRYDKTSEALRYHEDTHRNPILKKEFIDIRLFYSTFIKLNNFFCGLSSYLQDGCDRIA